MRQITIAVGCTLCRWGLQAIVEKEKWACDASVRNRHELLKQLTPMGERIVVIDSKFCPQGSRSLIRAVKRVAPRTRIIFWGFKLGNAIDHYQDDEHIHGYLYQYEGPQELLKAFKQVNLGYKYFSPYLSEVFRRIRSDSDEQPLLHGLSKRERLVLQLLCSGDTVADIAKRLYISRKTVNTFRYRLFKKTNTESDVQLVHLAIGSGLVPLTPHPQEQGRLPVSD